MKYRKMGNLDWEVSALGFGCMRLAQKNRLFLKSYDDKESIRIIRHGIDLGINYIDTAWMYHFGRSEPTVGKALLDGYRNKVKLVTKLPMMFVRKSEDFEKYLHSQLERLQTDYLDMYLFHGLNQKQFAKLKSLDLMPKMLKAKEQGLIKHIGFSFHDTLPVFKEIIDYHDWDATQIQYNYMDTAIQATTQGLMYAADKGIAVIVMEPIKGGYLANPPAQAREIMEKASIKRSPVDWALQFLWNIPEISVVLSGMGSQKMVDENCNSAEQAEVGSLSEVDIEIIEELSTVFKKLRVVDCTACNYCMPCPAKVDIPKNFAIINNISIARQGDIVQKGMTFMIRRGYSKLAKTKEEAKQKNIGGKASVCTECGACVEKCPQQINIPEALKKTHLVLGKRKKLEEVF